MGDWVVTFDGLEPALVRADSRDHAIRAACALCGSEAIAAGVDIRARRARGGEDGRYPVVEVHDWHRSDETISACRLPAGEVVRAWGEGQATCPACLEVLREERLEATAAAVTRAVMEMLARARGKMRSATGRPCYCGSEMNQTNLTIIGTGIGVTAVIVSTVAVVAGGINDHLTAITGQMGVMNDRIESIDRRLDSTNGRIDALRSDVTAQIDGLRSDIREDHREFNIRLRNVEVEFGKVEQRLETLERAVIPSAPPAD